MRGPYVMSMAMFVKPVIWGCMTAAALIGASAVSARDHAWRDRSVAQRAQAYGNLPAREIERRVIPTMPGAQYLGFIYDGETNIYTLKFLRNGSVIWIDVDGRTGTIVRRTGR
ncbi:MAG: hypothetical protein WDN44_10175 [Sphingomonas sp.]